MNRSKLIEIAPFALIAGFAIAIYAYVLPLPFFRDDMVMLLWLHDMPWGKLWIDATGFPYFRPLSFSTLKLSELVFGWPEPISLHLLNLALHAANSVMVALLAHRFFEGRGRWPAAISAGLLFAAYPFTFEIVPTTGPIFQLQAAFFGLAAALTYSRYRSTVHASHSARKWLWASLALALLGAFTCEYGVIIPAFIVVVEGMLWWKGKTVFLPDPLPSAAREPGPFSRPSGRTGNVGKFSLIPFVYIAFSTLYLVAWILVPKSRAEPPLILQGLTPALLNMPVTALYYLQGLTYPLQTLAWPLVRVTGMSQWLAVSLVTAATLAIIVALFAWGKRMSLLAFALAWFAIAVAPMWPTLNADYTLNGPRLHYLPSIATSIIWGSAVAIVWNSFYRQDTKIAKKNLENLRVLRVLAVRTLGVLVLAVILAQSLLFLHTMANIITIGARLTADVSRAVAAQPPDEPMLVLNFPSWIGQRDDETTFALGAEGISFLPGYSSMRDMVRLNTRQDRNIQERTFTSTVKDWKYNQRLGLLVDWNDLTKAIRKARRVWVVEYLTDTLRLSEAGSVQALSSQFEPEVTFGDSISLTAVDSQLTPDELKLELAWLNIPPINRQLTAFVHVYDLQGKLIAQQDGYPLLGHYPPWLARRGEVVRDLRHIPLPGHLPAGHYTVGVGIYDAETGKRLAALSPQGNRFENDVYLFYAFDTKP